MAFAINLLCLSGFIEQSQFGHLRRIADLGYDGVEVPVLSGDVAHYAGLASELDALGLRRTCTAVVPSPEANPLSSDPETRARGRVHLDWALDCAVALGAESLGGPIHAPIGHFTGAGPSGDEISFGAEAHRRLAERASAEGLYLSLEPLNRFETHFLNTMEQARSYVARVDHPAFRIMYDTFHANIEERSQPRAIESMAGHLGVVHISENDRGIPGRGHIDFPEVFRALHRAGHDGWLTVEAFGAGLPKLAAATRVWRPLFPDFETLFAESLDFMRRTWAETAS